MAPTHEPGPILVMEPNFTGHRMLYARYLLDYANDLGRRGVLATSHDTLGSDEYQSHVVRSGVRHDIIDLGPYRAGDLVSLARRVTRSARGHQFDRIVVPEGDKMLVPFAFMPIRRRAAQRITVLVMRAPAQTRGTVSRGVAVKRAMLRACLWRGYRVVVLAPATPASDSYEVGGYVAAPDPVEVQPTADLVEVFRRGLDPDGSRTTFGVFGNISHRKNLGLVLAALIARGAGGTSLAIGGVVEPDERARCAELLIAYQDAGGRVLDHGRLLDDTELDSMVAAVDAAVLAHSGEGPSGILGKAAAVGTYVVAAGSHSLRDDVERLDCGEWVPLVRDELASALGRVELAARPRVHLAGPSEFARALVGMK